MSEHPLNPMRRESDKTPVPHPHTADEPCPGGCEELKTIEEQIAFADQQIGVLNRRINDSHDRLVRIETRLDDSAVKVGAIEALLNVNNSQMASNSAETSEILDILRMGKSFFRWAGLFGSLLKWSTAIAASVVAMWATLRLGSKV